MCGSTKLPLIPVGRASCPIYKAPVGRYAYSTSVNQFSQAPVALNPACPDLSGIYRGGATCVSSIRLLLIGIGHQNSTYRLSSNLCYSKILIIALRHFPLTSNSERKNVKSKKANNEFMSQTINSLPTNPNAFCVMDA